MRRAHAQVPVACGGSGTARRLRRRVRARAGFGSNGLETVAWPGSSIPGKQLPDDKPNFRRPLQRIAGAESENTRGRASQPAPRGLRCASFTSISDFNFKENQMLKKVAVPLMLLSLGVFSAGLSSIGCGSSSSNNDGGGTGGVGGHATGGTAGHATGGTPGTGGTATGGVGGAAGHGQAEQRRRRGRRCSGRCGWWCSGPPGRRGSGRRGRWGSGRRGWWGSGRRGRFVGWRRRRRDSQGL